MERVAVIATAAIMLVVALSVPSGNVTVAVVVFALLGVAAWTIGYLRRKG